MKSKIKNIIDYRTVPVAWEVSLVCPQEELQKALRQVTRDFKQRQDAKIISKGDVALLKLESANPKFQKSMVPVTVGSGLYSQELEAQLLGHEVEESFRTQVGEDAVQVTVLKCIHTVYPEVTDEMVEAFVKKQEGYEDVDSVEALLKKTRKDYAREKRQNAVYERMQQIMDYVLTNEPTDIDFDPEEMEQLRQANLEHARREVMNDKKMDTVTDEDIAAYYHMDSVEQMNRELKASCQWQIAPALWVAHEKGLDASKLELDDEKLYDYDFLEAYVRERIIYKED